MEIKRPIQGVLFDMDGVIYRGDHALPGAAAIFPALTEAGIPFTLITNNSRMTPHRYAEKLDTMSIRIAPERVITSAMATATWLKEQSPEGAKVFVVGAPDLVRVVLDNPGFSIDADKPDYVIVGLDYDLTYARLRDAVVAINNGARFVATNTDTNIPVEGGQIWPGAGAIVAAIQAATGKGPVAALGKPETHLLELALEKMGADREHCLMVGDRADTDIWAGYRARMPTALVLTGVTQRSEVPNLPAEMQPDYVFDSLDELAAFILQDGE